MDEPASQDRREDAEQLTFPNYEEEASKAKQFLLEYQDFGATEAKYLAILQEVANRKTKLVTVDLDDVLRWEDRSFEDLDSLGARIARNAPRYLEVFADAVDEVMPEPTEPLETHDILDVLIQQRRAQRDIVRSRAMDPDNPDGELELEALAEPPAALLRRFEVFFEPAKSLKGVAIRDVGADCIGSLVRIKALVTRVSTVRPLMQVATYSCDSCPHETYQEIEGRQWTPRDGCQSAHCLSNRTRGRLQLQTRGSKFQPFQEIKLQELPDQVPMGHVPRTLTAHLRGQLVRGARPGELLSLSAIFLPVRFSGFRQLKAGLIADTFLLGQHIFRHKKSYGEMMDMDAGVEDAVYALADEPDAYSRLARSIAPEIWGNEDVKKALLLMLTGGTHRTLPDGMTIRGDLHLCLMGDPGIAKSQLLKYMASVAPRAVYTTGKGSSGVGLTAAVTRDQMSGEMSLEGGALVLADKGICCIDEFDKMDDQDRTAIHEVMEQQTVSIAKAGITTRLNARTAVLAAANPLYGRYNKARSISENVNLPNSLLSRFDLLFLLLDKVNVEADLALARHVTHVHRFKKSPGARTEEAIPSAILRHYVAQARLVQPTVPRDLMPHLVETYAQMRQGDASHDPGADASGAAAMRRRASEQTQMTPRQLLSILRMSTALARLRFAKEVSQGDVEEAVRLVHMSKASLFDDEAGGFGGLGGRREDPVSRIYGILRDYAATQQLQQLRYGTVEAMVLKNGFTEEQLEDCLEEYQELNILQIDADRSYIHFVSN